ncbi:uncharacterized protein LOC113321966 [Papaver somniferum]|uniref:uncharacterized protein LOC113321966 n=1 Tax=Papaver somniferum TaxID=3469 RepID=UPI000E6FBBE2|nr:uncharacterized protein LOC113321966 [Papaver somniferum]
METSGKDLNLDLGASLTSVYEIPGEPAIVINGMPDLNDLVVELEISSSSSMSDDELSDGDEKKPNVVTGGSSVDGKMLGVAEGDCSTEADIKRDVEEPKRNAGFGEWLQGREVRKLFGDEFYSGKVKKYDKEAGWYRVVYEDGDSEDLEWNELEEILLPLDISIPLKSLAMKISKKSEKRTLKKGEKPNQKKGDTRKGGRSAKQ